MLRRTTFRGDIKKDTGCDYVLIDYDEAISIIKRWKSSNYTTIQGVCNVLNCDVRTALGVMGYLYYNKMLYRVTPTLYVYNF